MGSPLLPPFHSLVSTKNELLRAAGQGDGGLGALSTLRASCSQWSLVCVELTIKIKFGIRRIPDYQNTTCRNSKAKSIYSIGQ